MSGALPPDTVCPVEDFQGLPLVDFFRVAAAGARARGHHVQAAAYDHDADNAEAFEFYRIAKGMLAQVGLNFWEVTTA